MSHASTVKLLLLAATSFLLCSAATTHAAKLSISGNKRHLLKDGKPFFYLCDSGWDVVMMLDRAEADEYFQDRADKGFNVIMTILIGWKPYRDERNAYREPPLINRDPARPNDKYFEHAAREQGDDRH